MWAVYSTAPLHTTLLLALFALAACVPALAPPGPKMTEPSQTDDSFIMEDGTLLPYRAWLPEREQAQDGPPWAVILALHGMNDSQDAWEYPAPAFTAAGIALFAPDQRGFGHTAQRGYWPGAQALADDAATMSRLLRSRYPSAKLFLMGESMGAATLMLASTGKAPPEADGYILLAPAVWGRAQMNILIRSSLWVVANLFPGLTTTGRAAGRVPSDNRDALEKLSRNPRTIKETRFDTIRGMADLMDAAHATAPRFRAPALVLYGGKDEIIPPRATRAVWSRLSDTVRRAYYPNGYHWLLRDRQRAIPLADIVAWAREPAQPLPAEAAAARFLIPPD